MRGLREGTTVTIRAWFKDEYQRQCTIHLRAHNASGTGNSEDTPYQAPGAEWTLQTLHYTVDQTQEMRLIIDMKGIGSIVIGKVEAEWR